MSRVLDIQNCLPRFLDESASIIVQLKRKLQYKHSYMSGVVRPVLILKALEALAQKTLYIENHITINKQWATQTSHAIADCIQLSPLLPHNEVDDDEIETETLVHSLYTSQQVVDYNSTVINIAP